MFLSYLLNMFIILKNKGLLVKKVFILFFITVTLQAQLVTQKDTLEFSFNQISVTATRYEENLLEIPYAVTLIPVSQLKNIRGFGFDEVLAKIPGVLAQSRSGNQDVRIVIRGFGARGAGDRSNSGTSRGIRVMIDGIPETEPDGRTSFDNIDLSLADNVEVIRSNASAVWGNAAGGVINITTVPSSSKDNLSLRALAGSFGFNQIQMKANINYTNGKLFASVSNSNFEGWRDHSSSYRSLFNLGLVSNLEENTKLGIYASAATNTFHIPGPLTQKQFDANPEQSNPTYLQRNERRINRLGKIGLTIFHSLDNSNTISGMLFANPKYLQRSERGTFRDFTRYHFGGNIMYMNTSELSSAIVNKFLVGGDEAYQDGAILFYSLSSTNSRGTELRENKREGANTIGAFLQNEIIFGDKISLLLGARYDNVTYYSESFILKGYGLQKKSFEKITPKAGFTYRISPTHSVYTNLGGGIEVPAGNETDPVGTYGDDLIYLINPLLEPIISTTYEVGTKQVFVFKTNEMIRNITYDIAAYYIDVKNDIIPYRGGRFYFAAGKTRRIGVELGTTAEFKNGFSANGSFTLSDNKYTEYRVDSVHYDKKLSGRFADYKNKNVAGIPNLFYSFGLTYTPQILSAVSFSLEMKGIVKYFVDDANSLSVPSFNVFGATISIAKPFKLLGGFSLSGFFSVNNLFDTKYASSAFINPDYINKEAVFLEPGLPRNFVLSVSLSY